MDQAQQDFFGLRGESAHSGCRSEDMEVLSSRRVLLIDDDPVFRSVFAKVALREGLDVEAFDSLIEVEPFSRISCYRGVIFDFHLDQIDGVELASHLESILDGIPMLLVSADGCAESTMLERCPGVFGAFMGKNEGCHRIAQKIRAMMNLSRRL
jgi:DNA-binding NtrC family response regulator